MRFAGADPPGVAAGEITIAFRRCQTARVTAGRVYRTAAGRVLVPDIRAVRPEDVTGADARAAGRKEAADLLGALPGDADGESHPQAL